MQRKPMNELSPLDKKRINEGSAQLKQDFFALGQENKEKAAELINDDNLNFFSLFTLMPEIDQLDLYHQLSYKNIVALQVTAKVLENEEVENKLGSFPTKDNKANQESLKWIVETGCADDGVYNKYDEVIDLSASLLIVNYQEYSILPSVADMIFSRNRNGLYNHDLVWSFHQAEDPRSLYLLADRLNSNNADDVELACKLLHVEPKQDRDLGREHQEYLNWLDENMQFLYYTGESLQQTSEPKYYRVNQEARYFHTPLNGKKASLGRKADYRQMERSNQFQRLEENTQRMLSRYSLKLHGIDQQQWKRWMSYSVRQQLDIVQKDMGGIS